MLPRRQCHHYYNNRTPPICCDQAGVSVTAWVFGHQLYELLGLLLHPLVFFIWMYVLTLTQVPVWSYYLTLFLVGYYTSSLGYLVR